MNKKLGLSEKLAAGAAVGLSVVGSASAALPTDVTDALDGAKADILLAVAAGGAALIAVKAAKVIWVAVSKAISRVGAGS